MTLTNLKVHIEECGRYKQANTVQSVGFSDISTPTHVVGDHHLLYHRMHPHLILRNFHLLSQKGKGNVWH